MTMTPPDSQDQSDEYAEREPGYLNTDVDLIGTGDRQELLIYLEDRSMILVNDDIDAEAAEAMSDGVVTEAGWIIRLESDTSGLSAEPGLDIDRLVRLLHDAQNLYPELFESLKFFDFNIGWQAADDQPTSEFRLSNEQLRAIAELGASATVTIYPPELED